MAINKVGSKGIEDCSVAAVDFAPGTVTSVKIADDAVTNAKLSNSSLTASGTSVALGASINLNNFFIDWQSKITSDGSTVTTMVAGRGYFVDNSSAAGIVKLPAAASIGDFVVIKDYAGNFGTNNLTIQRNSHNIQGVANDSAISTNRASLVLVYVDSTKGWLYTDEHNVADLQFTQFTEATGGTITTSGDFKIHTFTGDGNFVVSQVGAGQGPTVVDYLVVAGGGGGNGGSQGAGGAGGFRLSNSTCMPAPLTSPLANPTGITLSVQTYPITVGSGGAGSNGAGAKGSDSVFSTITSTGGGHGESGTGGSGGGGGATGSGAAGNTPPVSPPQGNNGGNGSPVQNVPQGGSSGGGGGAGAVGGNGSTSAAGAGGAGSYVLQTGFAGCNGTPGPVSSTRYFSGGGGGGTYLSATGGSGANGGGNGGNSNQPTATAGTAASANTGSGGGGGGHSGSAYTSGAAGGKGIVILRYKYQ